MKRQYTISKIINLISCAVYNLDAAILTFLTLPTEPYQYHLSSKSLNLCENKSQMPKVDSLQTQDETAAC